MDSATKIYRGVRLLWAKSSVMPLDMRGELCSVLCKYMIISLA